jgi:SAM-dependent methyltransferase
VLDLGCGSGRHTVEACRWPCRVTGVDLSRQDLRVARYMLADLQRRKIAPGHADFVIADAQHLPFRDGAFDKVVCTEVLEHIPDDRAGVRELVRVLRAGGDIAVSVPSHGPEVVFWTISWEYWHSPGGHVRIYPPGEMWRMLEERGLQLRLQRRRHSFQTVYWFVRCVFGKDNDYFPLTRLLTRFINWYHNRRRVRPLEYVESVLDLVLGKDTILYGTKPASEGGGGLAGPGPEPKARPRGREAA